MATSVLVRDGEELQREGVDEDHPNGVGFPVHSVMEALGIASEHLTPAMYNSMGVILPLPGGGNITAMLGGSPTLIRVTVEDSDGNHKEAVADTTICDVTEGGVQFLLDGQQVMAVQ